MRRRAFPDEPWAGLLQADEVARATIGLLRSPLTGQVLDVRRGDPGGEGRDGAALGDPAPGTGGPLRPPARNARG
jgi:2-C-methyl-D-erythritol 4-phosphate cytidylyltransferase